jgi:hypothetical protein
MQLIKFKEFQDRYGEDRVRDWMGPQMAKVPFVPEVVLIMGHHVDFYTHYIDLKPMLKKRIAANPGVDFVIPAIYFESETDGIMWLLQG